MQLPAYRKHAAHPSFDTKLSVRRTKYPYELTIRIESILLFCFTYVGTIARKLWRTITETRSTERILRNDHVFRARTRLHQLEHRGSDMRIRDLV